MPKMAVWTLEVKVESLRLIVMRVGDDVFFEGYIALFDFMRGVNLNWGSRFRGKPCDF